MHAVGLPVVVGLLFSVGCKRQEEPEPSPKRPASASNVREIPGCGASLVAPPGSRTLPPRDGLQLVVAESAGVGASCQLKRESGPQSLAQYVAGVADELSQPTQRMQFGPLDTSALQRMLGRPVVGIEGVPTDSSEPRASLIAFESAAAFYWIVYSAKASEWDAHAQYRDALFASFRITDPNADRGPTRWWHPPINVESRTLSAARSSFRTKVHGGRPTSGDFSGQPPPTPPATTFVRVDASGPQGRLATYVTPDPKDGKKHPAVIWAHGGFGGIDHWFWEPAPRSNDQSARAFRDAGIVLAVGSWRAENDNPGDYQLYYGEVDDFLAIRDRVRALPYVDPERIYLAGHSSGGTLVLLAAELTDGFRAAFSIGGSPMMDDLTLYERYGGVPFDPDNKTELLLRSAAPFVRSIRRPTFYFEGTSGSVGAAQWMEDEATKAGVPFKSFVALQATHFTILAPLTELIATKILADTGRTTNIAFTPAEIDGLEVADE